MPTYLVTGAAGFIGSHLAQALLELGCTVRGLDNLSSGSLHNVAHLPQLDLIEADVRSPTALRRAMQGVDCVLHHAAMASVAHCVDRPELSHAVNAVGTYNVLEAARTAGSVRRLVFASSSAVYGNAHAPPLQESFPACPLSPYAADKLRGEQAVRHYHQTQGLPGVVFRYFNIFGPRQDASSGYAAAIPLFIGRLLHSRPPIIFGDGHQTRDFTYVADVVAANLLACQAAAAPAEPLNIACGQATSLLQVLDSLSTLLGCRIAPQLQAPRLHEVRHSTAAVTSAQQALGFVAQTSLHQGLAATVDWYKAQAATPHPAHEAGSVFLTA
jgi:nucleoside-diphosphate-sugar epimerase